MKFIAVVLAVLLVNGAVCAKDKDTEHKDLFEKAQGLLADLTIKTANLATEILNKVNTEAQKIIKKIEDNTENVINVVDKTISFQLNTVAKLAETAEKMGISIAGCVEEPSKELAQKNETFNTECWECNRVGIDYISDTINNGVNEINEINQKVEELAEELKVCDSNGIMCLGEFCTKIVLEQPKFFFKMNKFLFTATMNMGKTFKKFLGCQANVQTQYLGEGLKIVGDMTKCLKDTITHKKPKEPKAPKE